MASNEEIFRSKKNSGGGVGGAGAGLARQREAAKERQAEDEHKAHERELAKQEPIPEKIADGNDVVLGNPRWDREKAFFMQDKVKASVDAIIPASRGEVKKIVFNLYALLPGGKRSDLIASVTGFPDKSGTATAEFTLFLPKNEERLIVKPVESYQYMFTAKHKYSKETTGPKLTVVDHAASLANFIPENFLIDLPRGIGDIHGGISAMTYWRTHKGKDVLCGGVQIALEFRIRNQAIRERFIKYKWKQTITTNDPSHGTKTTYLDVLESELRKYGDGHEYWYGDGQDRNYQNGIFAVSDGDYFSDAPSRPFQVKHPTTWSARLALYGVEASGTSKELGAIRYGFVLSNENDIVINEPKISK